MSVADIAWAIESIKARSERYALYRSYDAGDHRLAFATLKWQNTFGYLFREFADNLCDDVVDGLSDRLQITAWTSDDKAVAEAANTIWDRNRGASRFGQVHRNGYRDGDGYLMVQSDKDNLSRFYPQRPEQMAVRYSVENPDDIEVMAKAWREGRRWRLNLYYPDHMEKYATRGTGLDGGLPNAKAFNPLPANELTQDEGRNAAAIAADTIPAWHYPNGTLSEYGRSVLRNIIPIQDALNKAVLDMLVAMEFLAYPQRWATGIQVERDPITGEEISPFRTGAERVWRVGNKDAALGQFEAASMENFLEVQDAFRLEIARKGGMAPGTIYMRQGAQTPPAGVALLVMDGRAIKWSRDRQRDWGHNHRETMAYAIGLEFPGLRDVTAEDLTIEWAPPETRDEKELLETLAMKRDLGVPERRLLLEYGYSQDDVDDFMEEAQVVGEDQAAAARMAAAKGLPQTVGAARALATATPAPPGPGVDILSA